MTLIYEEKISPKSAEHYDKFYTKKEIIDMYRDLVGKFNHINNSRKTLKAVITRMKEIPPTKKGYIREKLPCGCWIYHKKGKPTTLADIDNFQHIANCEKVRK